MTRRRFPIAERPVRSALRARGRAASPSAPQEPPRPPARRRRYSDQLAQSLDQLLLAQRRAPRLAARAATLAAASAVRRARAHEPPRIWEREAPEWREAAYTEIPFGDARGRRHGARRAATTFEQARAPGVLAQGVLAFGVVLAIGLAAAQGVITQPERGAVEQARATASFAAPLERNDPRIEPIRIARSAGDDEGRLVAAAPTKTAAEQQGRLSPPEIETRTIPPIRLEAPPLTAPSLIDIWTRAAIAALPAALRGDGGGAARLLDLRLTPISLLEDGGPGRAPRGIALFVTPDGACARRDLFFTAENADPASTRFWGVGRALPTPCPARTLHLSEQISTASLSAAAPPGDGHLSGAELAELLARRPLKCLARPGPAGDGAAECAESTLYDPASAQFTRVARLGQAGRLEINAAFSLEHDAVCHLTEGLSALVLGEAMAFEAALSLEARVAERHRAAPDGKICHRLRRIWRADGGEAFVADAYLIDPNGGPRHDPSRSDPRPFILTEIPAAAAQPS